MASMASGMSIQGLWAGPWLRDVAGFDSQTVATYLFALALALTIGFVATGVVADRLAARGLSLSSVMGAGMILYALSLGAILLQLAPEAVWPWVLFGLLSNFSALAYPQLSRHFPLSYAGRANTALNLLVFLAAFAAQYLTGLVIDQWATVDGRSPSVAYTAAFGAILAVQLAALAWFYLSGGGRLSDEPEAAAADKAGAARSRPAP